MPGLRIALLLGCLMAAGCTATPPTMPAAPVTVAEAAAEAPAPAAASPAKVASGQLAKPLAVALGPRSSWKRIPITSKGGIAQAYAASAVVGPKGGARRGWVVLNLVDPIRLPETGGTARSVAFLADYLCDKHSWKPVLGIWYEKRDAVGEVLRDRPRGKRGIDQVGAGTLVDVFLDAACRA